MYIRRAELKDMPGLNHLLRQVLMVHHNGRPDLFKAGAKKYTDDDFIKCTCGRTIPKTRKECVYCGEKNPYFVPTDKNVNRKNNKKK